MQAAYFAFVPYLYYITLKNDGENKKSESSIRAAGFTHGIAKVVMAKLHIRASKKVVKNKVAFILAVSFSWKFGTQLQ